MESMTTEEIYEGLASAFQSYSGTSSACSTELSIRFHAVAAQIHALYAQCQWVQEQCFPQTATGTYLDNHAAMRGLERKTAVHAKGTLRFLVDTPRDVDLSIPLGTVCMTVDQVSFATTVSAVLPAGASVIDVPAQAVEVGSAGNVAADRVIVMSLAPVGISSCTNPTPFRDGSDAESDDQLRQRVLRSYRFLSNGGNKAYYEQIALDFDGVAAVSVIPRARGQGTVDLYIAAQDGLPSAELVEELQAYFQTQRELAVDVAVSEPSTTSVNLSISLAVEDGQSFDTVSSQVAEVIQGYFTGTLLGKGLSLKRLGALIFGVEGVQDYEILSPTADISSSDEQLVLLGTLTLTEQEES